jgi:hypothetical protein
MRQTQSKDPEEANPASIVSSFSTQNVKPHHIFKKFSISFFPCAVNTLSG